MQIPNLAFIKNQFGARLYEAFNSIQTQSQASEQQTNANPLGHPDPPPAINGVHASTGPGGEFQVAITDNGMVSRGVKYFIEHDSDSQFSNPHIIDNGTSRNWAGHMGNQTLYFRAYSSYGSSATSPAAYHGSKAQPLPVTGGVAGTRAPSQGAGTGAPRQGLHGPGPVAQRSGVAGFDWTAQGSNGPNTLK